MKTARHPSISADAVLYVWLITLLGLVLGAGGEGVRWLRSGSWAPLLTRPYGEPFFDAAWLAEPSAWLGFHRVVTWGLDWPLFVTVPALFLGLGLVVLAAVSLASWVVTLLLGTR